MERVDRSTCLKFEAVIHQAIGVEGAKKFRFPVVLMT